MDIDRIRQNLKRWRTQALYNFEWIVPLYEVFELIISDFKNINTFATDIISLINNKNDTVFSNVNLEESNFYGRLGRGDSNSTTVSINSFFASLYEIFDGFDLFFGNRREIPYILDQLLVAFEKIDIFQILKATQLQFKLVEMFNGFLYSNKIRSDNGWEVVAGFFQDEFDFSEHETDIMSQLLVKLSKVFIFGGFSELAICDPEQLSLFLITPLPSPDGDGGPSLEIIDGKLCNMTIQETGALMPIAYEEFRFEDFIALYLNIDIETILEAAGVTEEEAEVALEAMQDGYDAYKILEDNFIRASELLSNASYEYENLTWVEMASSFTCGQKDEFMIGNYNLNNLFDNPVEDNDNQNGENNEDVHNGNHTKEATCEEFIDTLKATETGDFLWGFIGHLVRGKLLFAPTDEFTIPIMEETNKTFLVISENVDRINAYASIGSQLDELRTMKGDLEIIQELLENSTIREMLEDAGMNETLIDLIIEFDVDGLIKTLEDTKELYTTDLDLFTNFLSCISTTDRIVGVKNETEILKWAVNATEASSDSFFAGISFLKEENYTKHVKYKLKMERGKHAKTSQIRSPYYVAGPESGFLGNLGYMVGFIQIQEIIDRSIIQTITEDDLQSEGSGTNIDFGLHQRRAKSYRDYDADSNLVINLGPTTSLDLDSIGVLTQEFPFPCYEVDWFLNQMYLSNIFQIALLFSYLGFIISNTRQQLWEKESQNADIMQSMGMQPRVIWLVWLAMCIINISIITSVLVILFKYGPFLPRSNAIIVWMVFFVIGLAIVTYCFMMCAIMTRTAIGSIITSICYVCSFIPYVILLLMKVIVIYQNV